MIKKIPQKTELKIPCLPEYISVVRLIISGIASRMSFDYDTIEDIKLAVSEACTNVIKHAYKKRHPGNSIKIRCSVYPHKLDIIVEDSGEGFQPRKIQSYQKGSTKTQTNGSLRLGIFFIKSLMDKVEITSAKKKGTQVHMVKNLVR